MNEILYMCNLTTSLDFPCNKQSLLYLAVTGVSAEWIDEFTSLRVSVPEGGTYKISYSEVNKSNATETKMVTIDSSSQVIKDGFRLDSYYIILVEAISLNSSKGVNGSVGIGENMTLHACSPVF